MLPGATPDSTLLNCTAFPCGTKLSQHCSALPCADLCWGYDSMAMRLLAVLDLPRVRVPSTNRWSIHLGSCHQSHEYGCNIMHRCSLAHCSEAISLMRVDPRHEDDSDEEEPENQLENIREIGNFEVAIELTRADTNWYQRFDLHHSSGVCGVCHRGREARDPESKYSLLHLGVGGAWPIHVPWAGHLGSFAQGPADIVNSWTVASQTSSNSGAGTSLLPSVAVNGITVWYVMTHVGAYQSVPVWQNLPLHRGEEIETEEDLPSPCDLALSCATGEGHQTKKFELWSRCRNLEWLELRLCPRRAVHSATLEQEGRTSKGYFAVSCSFTRAKAHSSQFQCQVRLHCFSRIGVQAFPLW